jgi:hypothetical protein
MVLTVTMETSCTSNEGTEDLHFPQQAGMDDRVIYDESLGVVLRQIGTLELGGSEFSHTFGIPITQDNIIPTFNLCPKNLETCKSEFSINCTTENIFYFCQRFQQAIRAYTEHEELLQMEYSENIKAIDTLLPRNIKKNKSTQFKRGLVDAGGWLAKQLFGVATEQDLAMLRNHIIQLEDTISQSNESFSQFKENLQSYGSKINKRVDNIRDGLTLHHKLLNDTMQHIGKIERTMFNIEPQLNTFYKRQHKITKYINLLHVYNVQHIHLLNALVRDSSERLQGVQSLVEGYLPVILIPPHVLESYIYKLDRFLKENHPGFSITHMKAKYYYHVKNIMYARTNRNLFISVKIPLSSTDTIFKLYNIDTVPVPMGPIEFHSEINNVPTYFAISSDNQFYLELAESDIKDCFGKTVKRCKQIMAIKERVLASCISSIFFQDHATAIKLCKGKVIGNETAFQTKIIDLGSGKLLVSTDHRHWIKSCASKPPVEFIGCLYCIIKVPCACSIRGSQFFIPSFMNNCFADSDIQMIQTDNALFSHHFYTSKELLKTPNITTGVKISNTLQPFKIDLRQSKWDDVLSVDKQLQLEVDTLANLVRNGKPLFTTPVDKLKYELEWVTNGFGKTIAIVVTIISVTLSITSLALNAILVQRINRIMAIITSLSLLATESDAKPLDSELNYSNNQTCYVSMISISLSCWAVAIIYIIKMLSVMCERRQNGTDKELITPLLECNLYLYVYSNVSSYKILICKLPFKVECIGFGNNDNLKFIHIKKTMIKCNLVLQWAAGAVKIDGIRHHYDLPEEIEVPKDKENEIRQVLASEKLFKLVATNDVTVATALCNAVIVQPEESIFNRLDRLTKAKWSKDASKIEFK